MRKWPCEICGVALFGGRDEHLMTCPAAHEHQMCLPCRVGLRDAGLLWGRPVGMLSGRGWRRGRRALMVASRRVRPCPTRLSPADLAVWALRGPKPVGKHAPF